MKTTRLIALCVSCVVLITALAIGLTFPSKPTTTKQNATTEPTIERLPTLPERVPEIPLGKYYCVAGTQIHLSTPRQIENIIKGLIPYILVDKDNVLVFSCGNDVMGYYQYNNENTITLTSDNIEQILTLYKFDNVSPSDSEFGEEEHPAEPITLSCTYDEIEQILHFTYGNNSLTLKRFASDEAATQWYQQYAIDGAFTFLQNYNEYQ